MSDELNLQEILQETENDTLKLTPKQTKILEAAIEIFSEKGYNATSTSEIAKRAGVAEGTIFRHYKTKKELLFSIVTPMITKVALPVFANKFVKEVFSPDYDRYDQLLRTLVYERYQFVKKNLPFLKIMLQEMAFHPELKEKLQQQFSQHVYPSFKEKVEHYQKEGQIRDYPVESVIRFVMTSIIGMIVTRLLILPDAEWDDEAEIERTIDFIMYGIHQS
ncbi:TetR family transcriptional regulator [Pontibacillus halophilus JSM 076056 = DSM 19796]|uniref:TetR family transcriptional regulator n=1 Tax=Pontibacillus halophilus JSM 076056 = DSM 19796 TaxID=1385510 RepID=A0A0A5GPD4_9BACI|nr:TetR/AcrR family transcriptional regulator [Pontibacillus halophilus]KGX92995.1 TetR family transcriptional regulator [Pontibacillus halophilus JSM 076056 = DSM 19796]